MGLKRESVPYWARTWFRKTSSTPFRSYAQTSVQHSQCRRITRASNMNSWNPISEFDFKELFDSQYSSLDSKSRDKFERYRVPFWRATIRRSDVAGDEAVFVVS